QVPPIACASVMQRRNVVDGLDAVIPAVGTRVTAKNRHEVLVLVCDLRQLRPSSHLRCDVTFWLITTMFDVPSASHGTVPLAVPFPIGATVLTIPIRVAFMELLDDLATTIRVRRIAFDPLLSV